MSLLVQKRSQIISLQEYCLAFICVVYLRLSILAKLLSMIVSGWQQSAQIMTKKSQDVSHNTMGTAPKLNILKLTVFVRHVGGNDSLFG